MAAIFDPDKEVDIKKLGKAITEKLPSYARPIFIRLVKMLDITGKLSYSSYWFVLCLLIINITIMTPTFIIGNNVLIFLGTYKLKKFNLQRQGYDLSDINKNAYDDKLFYFNAKVAAYEILTEDHYKSITSGLIRVWEKCGQNRSIIKCCKGT